MPAIDAIHYSDPGCPWAWSASPAFAVLRWRFGDNLRWRHVMIGLREQPAVNSAYTPERQAQGWMHFRDTYGMPFSPQAKARPAATSPGCRAVVATRLAHPDREFASFRALQQMNFTTSSLLDESDDLRTALAGVDGVDADAVVAAIDSPEVREAYEADRSLARSAQGGPTDVQGRASNSDGAVRFTAPSVQFSNGDAQLEVGGFQPMEAYDTALANLEKSLERRDHTEDAAEILAAFPDGLYTAEVAAIMTPRLGVIDRPKAERALISAVAAGDATRTPVGDSALWKAAA